MTVDDENSIYVGGLPYDSTEDSVRRAFEMYGTITGIKIVNDRKIGGKCYGFVTFTNPRSAINAIDDMDRKTIGGRIVRVNEVRSKSSRPAVARDNFFRDRVKFRDRDRNKDRERSERDDVRELHRERDRERIRERFSDRDYKYRNSIGHHISSPREQKHSSFVHSQHESDQAIRGRSYSDSSSGRKRNASSSPSPKRNDRFHLEETSSHLKLSSFRDRDIEMREGLDEARQRREELQHEVAALEEESNMKRIQISKLQRKGEKLEQSMLGAKKKTAERKDQLKKLQNCYLQVKECSAKLKSYEQELQALVDASVLELNGLNEGNENGYMQYANGNNRSI
eukprot:TRINITY_DN11860_c0_g1_i1.p1 TRINITY_DN11860_c0_g1~~TRINITY_DN11860_c0_g1_i1.p1  ORF type:complete len:340 (+),score=82.54 TRINITY_DN11860_c0_g1_i1:347-1366(+)